MSTYRRRSSVTTALIVFVLVALACGPASTGAAPSITITSPADGAQVAVGEQVYIATTSAADAGVARVEMSVNGQLVRADAPPEGSPATFSISQPWTPVAPGEVLVSVVAYDGEGTASPPATIRLQVTGSSGAVTATPEPGETPEESAPETPVPDEEGEGGCTLNAAYVSDVTIPDDTVVSPGESFVKTWRVRNSGTCDWESGFRLTFVGGNQMGAPSSVDVPATAAGSQVDVSVEMTAPTTPDTYRSSWRVQSDTGTTFGSTLYVQVVVPEPVTPTPTESPTAPPTNLAATVQSDGSVRFTWDDATGESSYEYEFDYNDGSIGAAETDSLPADTTSWTSPALPCGSTGSFVIIAREPGGAEIGRESTDFDTPACADGPDLYISQLTIDPSNPQSGDTVHVSVSTYNRGNQAAGPYRVTFRYHSTPASVCEWEMDGMVPNGGQVLHCTVAVFQPYTAVATSDVDDQVDETDEDNNTEEIEIPVPAGTGVDLYISELSVTPSNPGSGDTVSARVGVYNRGTTAAGPFSVQWRYGTGDFDVCEWDLDSMSARGGRILHCDVPIYASYNTVATADAYGELSESVETNNTRSFRVTVGP